MGEYTVEVEGINSLQNIQLAIAGEEATGAEFIRSTLSRHESKFTNLVTFNDLEPGQRPQSELVLIKQGQQAPSGKNQVWSGVLLVSGSNESIIAYR